MSVRVKICGITRIEDARAAIEFGVDMIGVNFYAPSPRSVSLARACEIRATIGSHCKVVGVFVNASRDFISTCLNEVRLDLLQFHGDEPDSMLDGWPVPVIRALRLKSGEQFEPARYASSIYTLLDTFHPGLYGFARPRSDARVHLGRPRSEQRGGSCGSLSLCHRCRERCRVGARHQGPRTDEEIHSQCQVCPIATATTARSAASTSPRR
jgi:phosphoribosylanthranilate isomerase